MRVRVTSRVRARARVNEVEGGVGGEGGYNDPARRYFLITLKTRFIIL